MHVSKEAEDTRLQTLCLHLKNLANELRGENHENGVKIVIQTPPQRVSREQQKTHKKVKPQEKHTISAKKNHPIVQMEKVQNKI